MPLAVAAAVTAGVVIAEEATSGLDPLTSYLLNFGILGVMTTLWLTGIIRTKGEVQRAEARADRAEARADAAEQARSELEASVRNDVVPSMTRFTDVASRILDRSA